MPAAAATPFSKHAVFAIPATMNSWLIGAIALFHGIVLLAFPLWLLPQSIHWAWLMLPLAWLHTTHWALIHEGIHKLLHPNPRVNEFYGRTLSILLGASFAVLRFGHLVHHQLNRDWHSEYVPSRNPLTKAVYYANLTVGLYLSELIGSIMLAVLPRRAFLWFAQNIGMKNYPDVVTSGDRFFYTRGNIATVRQDTLAFILLYSAAFAVYGVYWPVLLGFLTLRALVVSLMDNIYHYGTPADNSRASKELHLPKLVSAMILHSNYHETHHLNPRLPWTALPEGHKAANRRFDGPLLTHGLVQFAGPLLQQSASATRQHTTHRTTAPMPMATA